MQLKFQISLICNHHHHIHTTLHFVSVRDVLLVRLPACPGCIMYKYTHPSSGVDPAWGRRLKPSTQELHGKKRDKKRKEGREEEERRAVRRRREMNSPKAQILDPPLIQLAVFSLRLRRGLGTLTPPSVIPPPSLALLVAEPIMAHACSCCLVAVLLLMMMFSTMTDGSASSSRRPRVEPPTVWGYRTFIVLLDRSVPQVVPP